MASWLLAKLLTRIGLRKRVMGTVTRGLIEIDMPAEIRSQLWDFVKRLKAMLP